MSLAIQTAKAEQRGMPTGHANAMGDPGLFSALGGILKGGINIATQFIPGPAGALIRSGIRKFTGPKLQQRPRVRPGIGRTFAPFQERGPVRTKRLRGQLVPPSLELEEQFFAPQAAAPTGAPQIATVGKPGIACPQGMRPNKSDYWRTDAGGRPVFVEAGTRCVAVRRRNPGNSRANDRAIARIGSAKRMAKTLGRITIRKECPS